MITEAEHVKSHQADDGVIPSDLPEQEVKKIIGNQAADQLATDAYDMHPALDQNEFAESKKDYYMAKNILLLAAKALPEWQASRKCGKTLQGGDHG